MFRLEKDVDFAWVETDFGSGREKYKITYYTLVLIFKLLKKYGHRDKYTWKHRKTDLTVTVDPKDDKNYLRIDKNYATNQYDLTDAKALAMRKEAVCTVLLDWEPGVILDKDGNNVQCGQKEKEQLMVDSPARVEWLLQQAMKSDTFMPDQEQEVKNSERPLNIETGAPATKSNSKVAETVST